MRCYGNLFTSMILAELCCRVAHQEKLLHSLSLTRSWRKQTPTYSSWLISWRYRYITASHSAPNYNMVELPHFNYGNGMTTFYWGIQKSLYLLLIITLLSRLELNQIHVIYYKLLTLL